MDKNDGTLSFDVVINTTNLDKMTKLVEDKLVGTVNKIEQRASSMEVTLVSTFSKINEQIRAQKDIISDLEKQYLQAQSEFEKINITTSDIAILEAREETANLFEELRLELDAEKGALEELETQYASLSIQYENIANQSKEFTIQISNLREEMTALEQQGQKETPRYRELQVELENTGAAYEEIQKKQEDVANSGDATIEGLLSGMSGLSGAFSAASGTMSLFGIENENLASIQKKLQTAIAITVGLQKVSEALHSTSAFRMNIVSKATALWESAIKTLNVQLGLSQTLSKGLASVGIGLLVAGITALILKYQDWSKENRRLNEQHVELTSNVIKEGIQIDILFGKLEKAQKGTSAYEKAKDNIISQYSGYLNGLGKEVSSLEDIDAAYKAISKSAIQAAKDRAISEATNDAAEKYSKVWINNITAIRDNKLVKDLEEEQVSELLNNIIEAVSSDLELDQSTKSTIDKFTEWTGHVGGVVKSNKVSAYIKNIRNAKETLNDEIKGINTIFESIGLIDKEDKITNLVENQQILRKEAQLMPQSTELEIAARNKKIKGIDEEIRRLNELGIKKKGDYPDRTSDSAKVLAQETAIKQARIEIEKSFLEERRNLTEIDSKQAIAEINKNWQTKKDIAEKAFEEENKQYRNVERQKEEVIKTSNELIAQHKKMGLESHIPQIEKVRDKTLAELSSMEIQGTDIWKSLFENLDSLSENTVKDVIARLREMVNAVGEDGKAVIPDIGRDKLNKDLDGVVKTIEAKNPFLLLTNGIKEYGKAESSLGRVKAFKKIGDASKEMSTIVSGSLGAVVTGLKDLGLMDEGTEKIYGDVVKLVTSLGDAGQGIARLSAGDISAAPQAIAGVFGAVTSVYSLFDSKSRRIDRQIKNHQKQLRELERIYDEIEYGLSNAVGEEYYADQISAIENIKEQEKEISELIRLEQSKKSKNRDDNAIEQWEKELVEAGRKIEGIQKEIAESLIQTNYKDISNQLADALVSAFEAGEDAAGSFDKVFDKVIANAIKNSLRLKHLDPLSKEIADDLATYMENNDNSAEGYDYEKWRPKLDKSSAAFMSGLEATEEFFDIDGTQRQGASSGLAQASQDSISELNGLMYATRQMVGDIRNDNQEDLLVQRSIVENLIIIVEHTAYLKNIHQSLNSMNSYGIKVKV